jgi:hypothetical protein
VVRVEAGAVLDAMPRTLTWDALRTPPAVAFHGTDFVVGWVSASFPQQLEATRVSTAGLPLDVPAPGIITLTGSSTGLRFAPTAAGTFVAFADNRGLLGARLSSSLVSLDGDGFTLAFRPGLRLAPRAASNAAATLITWQEETGQGDVFAARISPSGVVLDAPPLALARGFPEQAEPAVATDGLDWLVVWIERRTSRFQIAGARVSGSGQVLDPTGFLISPGPGAQGGPAVAWDGEQYVVAWADARSTTTGSDVMAARVLRDGGVRDPLGLSVVSAPDNQFAPTVAPLGMGTVVAWLDRRTTTGSAVYAGRLARDGGRLDGSGFELPAGGFGNESVAAAGSDAGALIVWSRFVGTTIARAARVTPAGLVLDDAGISLDQPSNTVGPPAVTFDGRQYLAAWFSTTTLVGATGRLVAERVGLDGTRLDPLGVTLSGPTRPASMPTLTCAQRSCLGAWVGVDATQAGGRLLFRLIDAQDELRARPLQVRTAEDTPVSLRLEGLRPDGGVVDGGLSYVVSQPAHGALSGTAPNLVYTPNPEFFGLDDFTYVVSDGVATSTPGDVRLTIDSINDPPVIQSMAIQTDEDTPVAFTPMASDVERDPLTWRVVSGPARGRLVVTAGVFQFTPAPDAFGVETATIEVSDGTSSSGPQAFQLFVVAVNDAPVAQGRRIQVRPAQAVPVVLEGLDVDGDPLTVQVVASPLNGALSGNGAIVTYRPADGFEGTDRFEFTVSDLSVTSSPAVIELEVRAAPPDAGALDAGFLDAGVPPAAGADAGTRPEPETPATGCGCHAGSSSLGLLLAAIGWRRRRSGLERQASGKGQRFNPP